jgi:hypothetical protein
VNIAPVGDLHTGCTAGSLTTMQALARALGTTGLLRITTQNRAGRQ